MSHAWQCDRCGKLIAGLRPLGYFYDIPTRVPPAPYVYTMGVLELALKHDDDALDICKACLIEIMNAVLTKEKVA